VRTAAEQPSGPADHPDANPALLMSGSLVVHLVHAWQPERRRSIRHSVTADYRSRRGVMRDGRRG